MENKRRVRAYLIALLAWGLAVFLALKLGADPDASFEIITQLRLPRAILATAVGIGLAVAGAALQALFTNPLCEPYTLGVSSGAAVGAVIGTALKLDWMVSGIAGTAFLGALLFAGALNLIARRAGRGNLTLLLAGVMLGFVGSSLVALWTALADPNGVHGAMFWLLGDLSRARMQGALFAVAGAGSLSFMVWRKSRYLDALLMGEEDAVALGIPVKNVRRGLIFLISMLVAICVSAAGMIGFVGLVVPHFARRFVGSLHLSLLPLAAIWGATALTAADALARVIARPYELPVGVVTALLGAPVFLGIILRRRPLV